MTDSPYNGYQPYGQPSQRPGQPDQPEQTNGLEPQQQASYQQSYEQPSQQPGQGQPAHSFEHRGYGQQPESRIEPVIPASSEYGQAAPTASVSGTPSHASTATSFEGTQTVPLHAQHEAVASPSPYGKKNGASGGKTFLFGFLGALLACVVCLGGYALIFGGGKGAASSTYIGTQDSSIIEATEEGSTLAEAVAAKVLPSVVAVYNYQDQSSASMYGQRSTTSSDLVATGMGSGVVISDDGYIITNYHVVDSAKVVTVSFNGEERDAKYIGGDSSSDIAVIKVDDASGLKAADIGDSDTLRIGEWVMTVGAPLGLEQSVATGVVSATNRSTYMDSSASDGYSMYTQTTPEYTYYPNMIQTDAVINPGNSGGALVDADGKLIGINAMISSYSGDYAGVGFAIPVNYAVGIATDVIAGKTPTHAMLGVSISTVNSQNAQRYGFSAKAGAYINAITPGTGAAESDLREGDIITAINGHEVSSATDVTLEVRSHNVGDTVSVTVDRNGAEEKVDVVLSSDELIANSAPQQNQQSPNGSGGTDGSNGNGYSRDDIERFLRLFGF